MRLVRLERQQSRVADDVRAALASLGRGSTVIGGIALVGVGSVTERPIEAVVLLPHGVIIVIGVDLPDPALRLEAPLGAEWRADGWPLVADDDAINPATEALDISQACEQRIASLVPGMGPVGTIVAVGPYVETVDQPATDLAGPVRVLHPTPTTMLAATVSLATAHRPRSVDQVRALIRGLAPDAPEFSDEVLLGEGFSRFTDDSPPESLWDSGPEVPGQGGAADSTEQTAHPAGSTGSPAEEPPAANGTEQTAPPEGSPAQEPLAAAPVEAAAPTAGSAVPDSPAPEPPASAAVEAAAPTASPAVPDSPAPKPPASAPIEATPPTTSPAVPDSPAPKPPAPAPGAPAEEAPAEPASPAGPSPLPEDSERTETLPSPIDPERTEKLSPPKDLERTEKLPAPTAPEKLPAPLFPGAAAPPRPAGHTERTASASAPFGNPPEPPRDSPRPFPTPRPVHRETAPASKTVRWIPLAAIGLLVALVVAAIAVATSGDDTASAPAGPPAPTTPPPPTSSFSTPPAQSLQFSLRAADRDQRCASHAFGDAQASLQQTSCSGVRRASYAATVDGRAAAVTIGIVEFPDAAQAAAFKAVADTPGGGGVLDLAAETGRWGATPAPRFENAAYASKVEGTSVRLVQAVWTPGPSTPDDPGLTRAVQAALGLPAQ
ncbi:hypothetical protein ACWEVP_48325 [Amycolatopsis sp. NPDC003865]